MTEQGGMVQCCNTLEPGQFRIGRVGLEFSEQCEVKLINKDEVLHKLSIVCNYCYRV